MIGVLVAAKFYFLDVWCPGRRQVKQIDLRALDRHPQTTLHDPMVSCQSCQPSPRLAQLKKLAQYSPNAPAYIPKRCI
jgi:hypothetical protein